MPHWLAHILGLDNPAGGWYLWHSGIEGNLGMLGAAYVLIRKHNCHQPRCWRVGRHTNDGKQYRCAKHHQP
jgi:hypothetical protein